jgi:hypothetical protein
MSPSQDTLATIVAQLGKLLEPLRAQTSPQSTRDFLAALGIELSGAQASAIATPIGELADEVGQLATSVEALVTAVEAGDDGTTLKVGLEAVPQVEGAIQKIGTLASAIEALGLPTVTIDAARLAEVIFDLLLGLYLERLGPLNDALELVGLVETENHEPADLAAPPFRTYEYDLEAIGEWLSEPAHKAQTLFGWGPGFDGSLLFPRIEKFLVMSGLPAIFDPAHPNQLDAVFAELTPANGGAPGLALKLKSHLEAGSEPQALGEEVTIDVTVGFDPPPGTEIAIGIDGAVTVTPPSPGPLAGELGAKLAVKPPPPAKAFLLFGQAGGSRLELAGLTAELGATLAGGAGAITGAVDIGGAIEGGKVVIDTTKGDGFLQKVLPGTKVEGGFDLAMGVSSARGFYFGGSSSLDVRMPVHIELGPATLQALNLEVGLHENHIPISVGADIGAELGPLQAVVQNVGVTATLTIEKGNGGNLGPLGLAIDFKAPSGVGLSVEAGPITGGGFLSLKPEKGEYFGALELSFQGLFALKAIGIVNTKMPDGSEGFALLILITAEFVPIQLGFGFTLLGVGGLLGLNRSLDSEALGQGVRTGSIQNVLFPPDVVGNIVQIVSDLRSFFPIEEGHFVVAPMGKLGWGTPTMISLELGVIIDIPSPQVAIIGVLRCILPEEDLPLLRLQVAFAGGIDFGKGLIWFDASLFDSGILVYTLSGDMALRIGWGDESIFVLTVGGFHPAFHEVPPDLTGMKRLTIALMSGDNPRLVAQSYFAVTSNTVQSGARVELYAAACGFNIFGYLGYDLLIQFDPFHFVANLGAGLALRRGTSTIAGISVSCELSGPTPWHGKGDASLEILFFSIDVGFDVTWGDDSPSLPTPTEDVLPLVLAAVNKDESWRSELPANTTQSVTLREATPPPGSLLVHPFGVLSVSQKVVPLDFKIDRFGNKKPSGDTSFAISRPGGGTDDTREQFAVAEFVTMSDSEKLSRKSFEQMKSGLRFGVGEGSEARARVEKDVTYELSYVHRHSSTIFLFALLPLQKVLFDQLSGAGAIAESALSVNKRRAGGNCPAAVAVTEAAFHVVKVSDLSPAGENASAATQAEAWALHDHLVAADPALAGTLQVVADHELAAA